MTKIQDNHKDLEQLSISTTALYKAFIELGGQKLMTIYCHPAKDLIVFDFECGRLTLNMKTGKLFSEIQDGSPLSPIPLMHPVLKKYSNGLLSESWTVYSPHSKTLGFLFNFGINEYENILFLCSNLPFFYVYQAPTLFENLVKENDESNITTDSILPQTQFLKFDFQKPKLKEEYENLATPLSKAASKTLKKVFLMYACHNPPKHNSRLKIEYPWGVCEDAQEMVVKICFQFEESYNVMCLSLKNSDDMYSDDIVCSWIDIEAEKQQHQTWTENIYMNTYDAQVYLHLQEASTMPFWRDYIGMQLEDIYLAYNWQINIDTLLFRFNNHKILQFHAQPAYLFCTQLHSGTLGDKRIQNLTK